MASWWLKFVLLVCLCLVVIVTTEETEQDSQVGEKQTCEKDSEKCKTEKEAKQINAAEVEVTDFPPSDVNVSHVVHQLLEGPGYHVIKQAFTAADVALARSIILEEIKHQGNKATHFQGKTDSSNAHLQARVWNLLNKGAVFEKMIQQPTILQVMRQILGDDCQLGSIASNTIFPGGPGQEPHIDYPYWDYYNKEHWPIPPKHRQLHYHLCVMTVILLDDLYPENGATALRPGSHLHPDYPTDADDFYKHMVQPGGTAGDVLLFVGLLQHCAMPNHSNASRTAVLNQYLPKYVRPMEDIKRSVSQDVRRNASPEMKRLLLEDYPYPAVLDEAAAGNSEGAYSDFDWK